MMNNNTKVLVNLMSTKLNNHSNPTDKDYYQSINHYLEATYCSIMSIKSAKATTKNSEAVKFFDNLLAHNMSDENAVLMYKGNPVRLVNREVDLKYLKLLINDVATHSMMTYRDALVYYTKTIYKTPTVLHKVAD